jgi:hypothetical protein
MNMVGVAEDGAEDETDSGRGHEEGESRGRGDGELVEKVERFCGR